MSFKDCGVLNASTKKPFAKGTEEDSPPKIDSLKTLAMDKTKRKSLSALKKRPPNFLILLFFRFRFCFRLLSLLPDFSEKKNFKKVTSRLISSLPPYSPLFFFLTPPLPPSSPRQTSHPAEQTQIGIENGRMGGAWLRQRMRESPK